MPTPSARTPHLATVVSLAAIAAIVATVLHEAVGHGGACVLSGGHNLLISSVAEDCSVANPWIEAAGTLVNLAAGAVFWWCSRHATRSAHLRLLLWLAMTFNWLDAAGYWLFSGVANIGDWAAILAGHRPAWLWHLGMALGGAAAYLLFVWLVVRELKPFLPRELPLRLARARQLMLTAYLTFGVLACLAGAFNPSGAILIVESAAAASFGGASGLFWGWRFVRDPYFASGGPTAAPLRPSRTWMIAAAILVVVFIGILGPGLRF